MNKLLILNGSHSEIEIIKEANRLNYFVITIGNNPNAPGNKLANKYYNIDYSDKEKVLKLCKDENISYIIPAANDLSLETFFFLKGHIGFDYFDSYEQYETIHKKQKFKALCQKLKINIPQTYSINKVSYPAIVKPVDNFGGRGISKVYQINDLDSGIKLAKEKSYSDEFIIEELLESKLYSLSTYLEEQNVKYFFDDIEYTNKSNFTVTLSEHPSDNTTKTINDLIFSIEKIANELTLTNGIFHIQYMMKDNKPYIIEATRRLSGDLYQRPLEASLNLNWSNIYINSILSNQINEQTLNKDKKRVGRLCVLSDQNGIFVEIQMNEVLSNIVIDIIEAIPKGCEITRYEIQRIAVLILDLEKLPVNYSVTELEGEYRVITKN